MDTPNSVWLLVLIWHFCIPSGMWFDVVSKNGCQEDTRSKEMASSVQNMVTILDQWSRRFLGIIG